MSATTTVAALADLARAAARTLTVATGAQRAAALNAIADEIESRSTEILAANKVDIDRVLPRECTHNYKIVCCSLLSALKELPMVRAK